MPSERCWELGARGVEGVREMSAAAGLFGTLCRALRAVFVVVDYFYFFI